LGKHDGVYGIKVKCDVMAEKAKNAARSNAEENKAAREAHVHAKIEEKPEAKQVIKAKEHFSPVPETRTVQELEAKTQAKSEKKPETSPQAKTSEKKIEKKKYIPYVKKENKKKSKEALEVQKTLGEKKHVPVMRGRFGKKNIRRKSIAKWDKWRKPHGIDLDKGLQHGFRPKIGYRSKTELRCIHPSGYKEVLVCNKNDLSKIDSKTQAVRFSATLGKKKRNELMKKANESGTWVLN
jgi:large subunit ribosomal protein L32e